MVFPWELRRQARRVFRGLTAERRTAAFAESCTGGLAAAGLTALPGASAFFLGSAVTYSNGLKTSLLGVDPGILEEKGAVSRDTALAMAEGIFRLTGADFSLSVTGVAGPGGGSAEKPVGTVWFACRSGDRCVAWTKRFSGSRRNIQKQAVLELYRVLLAGPPVDSP